MFPLAWRPSRSIGPAETHPDECWFADDPDPKESAGIGIAGETENAEAGALDAAPPALDREAPSSLGLDIGAPESLDDDWAFEPDLVAEQACGDLLGREPDLDAAHQVEDPLGFELSPTWIDDDEREDERAVEPVPDTSDDEISWRVGDRAAALANQLDFTTRWGQARALNGLIKLLIEFPHGSSHAAIERLVKGGISFDELIAAAAIKRAWRSNSSLWLVRPHHWRDRGWNDVIVDHRHGPNALTWMQAARLAAILDPDVATLALTGEWRDAWLELEPGESGGVSYSTYVGLRAREIASETLVPVEFREVVGDGYSWTRGLDPELARAVAPDGRLPYHSLTIDFLACEPRSYRDDRDAQISR